jgi:hypothetical protein
MLNIGVDKPVSTYVALEDEDLSCGVTAIII